MANGYCPYLLDTLSQIAGENDPQVKITPPGFTRLLLENNPSLSVISGFTTVAPSGHKKTIRYKYQPRYTAEIVTDEMTCESGVTPLYYEGTLENPLSVSTNIYIEDAEIALFCEDASQVLSVGKPATQMMREHLRSVTRAANALIGAMDKKLLNAVNFGVNTVTGNDTPIAVNFNKDAMVRSLTDGLTKILQDASENEVQGDLLIAGSGLMNNYELQRAISGLAASGLDVSKFTGYNWYNDIYAQTYFGTNGIGVFEKGSIGLIDANDYVGFRAGKKGTSEFFQLPIPVTVDGRTIEVMFNAQLKYYDCAFEDVDYYGNSVTYQPGYKLILSKYFGLFQWPNDVFRGGDRLEGVNGAFAYTATNDCDPCVVEEEV